jgi:hypothetical protein
MTGNQRFALISGKIERAKHHLHDLEIARDRFFNSDPYQINCENDLQTGHNIYRIFDIQTPPAEIGLIAGDLIHNLRSALDHLAFQLVYANGSTHSKQTSFPIWDSASEYYAQRARRLTGMAQAAIDAIDASEPYQGGKGAGFWVLHYLDIADKHRALLTPVMNVTDARFTIPGYWERSYTGVGGVSFPKFGKPLKDGDVVATREAAKDKDMNLTVDVAFTEPAVIEGRSVIKTVRLLLELVDKLIVDFAPLLN